MMLQGSGSPTPPNQNAYDGYDIIKLMKVIQTLGGLWKRSLDVKNLTNETYSAFVSFWSGENQRFSPPDRVEPPMSRGGPRKRVHTPWG